jgi:NAD(P)-dependent dehydrogenase (short-subunit alcohol dehydrogenase family)
VAVTGGSGGIGRAICARFAADGHQVTGIDIAGDADLVLDVAAEPSVTAAAAVLDQVDVLVNAAGVIGPIGPLWEVSHADFARTLEVNLVSAFLMCRAVVPGMRRRGFGRIVNIASAAGKDGPPHLAAYSASKAGLIALTKSLGKEVARDGVTVNAVTPGLIDTAMPAQLDPVGFEGFERAIPMGRIGRPEEVAELVAWIASPACSFTTAAVFDLSGGKSTW